MNFASILLDQDCIKLWKQLQTNHYLVIASCYWTISIHNLLFKMCLHLVWSCQEILLINEHNEGLYVWLKLLIVESKQSCGHALHNLDCDTDTCNTTDWMRMLIKFSTEFFYNLKVCSVWLFFNLIASLHTYMSQQICDLVLSL